MLEEALVQTVQLALRCLLLRLRLDESGDQPDDQSIGRQQQNSGSHPEEGIDQRDVHRVHGHLFDAEGEDRVENVIQNADDQRAHQLDDQIGERRPAAVHLGAKGGKQNRKRRTDGNTQDQREGGIKMDRAGHGQGLQDTDGGRRALQHRGEGGADQDAQQRVGEGRHQLEKALIALERFHRAAHILHAEHEDREAQEDIPHMVMHLLLGEHAHQNADHRHDGGQGGGGKEACPAGAGHAGKGDDPAGDAGADEGSLDHGDSLLQLHHAGVHKAHHHDRGGGRGLDHGGDAGAQDGPAQRRAGEAIEHQLHLVARNALQSVPHQAHAEEEERNAAQQRQNIGYIHIYHSNAQILLI